METKNIQEQEIIARLTKDGLSCGEMLEQLTPEERNKYRNHILQCQGTNACIANLIRFNLINIDIIKQILELGEDYIHAYLGLCRSIHESGGDRDRTGLMFFKDIVYTQGRLGEIEKLKHYNLFEAEDEAEFFKFQSYKDDLEKNKIVETYIKGYNLYPESIKFLTYPAYKNFYKMYCHFRKIEVRQRVYLSYLKVLHKIKVYLELECEYGQLQK